MKRILTILFVILFFISCSDKGTTVNKSVETSVEVHEESIDAQQEENFGVGSEINVQLVYFTYDSNGATSGNVPLTSNTVPIGKTVSVSPNSGDLIKDDSIFLGWNSERDGSGISFDVDSEIVIAFCSLGGAATCTYTNSLNVVDVPTFSEWVL